MPVRQDEFDGIGNPVVRAAECGSAYRLIVFFVAMTSFSTFILFPVRIAKFQ